jgi:hypothetical protein
MGPVDRARAGPIADPDDTEDRPGESTHFAYHLAYQIRQLFLGRRQVEALLVLRDRLGVAVERGVADVSL